MPLRGRITLATTLGFALSLLVSPEAPSHAPSFRGPTELRTPIDAPSPAVAMVLEFLTPWRTGLSERETRRLAKVLVTEAHRARLDPELVLAVIRVESSGNPRAVSRVGAVGLMQLLPDTARAEARRIGVSWRGHETLYDPFANVRLGISYLESLTRRFGDIDTALAAYNWGPTHIAYRIRSEQTLPVVYTRRVLSHYEGAMHTST